MLNEAVKIYENWIKPHQNSEMGALVKDQMVEQ
jgi:hypothetical protein